MRRSFRDLLKLVFSTRSARWLLLAGILSVAFSFAVILGTQGVMNGYEANLMQSSHKGVGDIQLYPLKGLSLVHPDFKSHFSQAGISSFTYIRQMESFFIREGEAKGVIVRGIDLSDFEKVTGIQIALNDGVAIGSALARNFNLKKGDEVSIAFARGNQTLSSLPNIYRFKVEDIIQHGIYEKDSRLIYLDRGFLNNLLKSRDIYNIIEVSLEDKPLFSRKIVKNRRSELIEIIGDDFSIKSFWSDHEIILKAVEVEKFSISVILYLIVFIAIFNIAALVFFIREKKLKEFFLIWSLGMSLKGLKKFWFSLTFFIWLISAVIALGLAHVLNILVQKFLVIPGQVYVLNELKLIFRWEETLVVLLFGLIWMMFISWLSLRKLYTTKLTQGLREEF